MNETMIFAVGSLVKARGREWIVLPESTEDLLSVRPLGGSDEEITGIYLPLEQVTPAVFELPDPTNPGDYRSAQLLRDAARLGFRSSAGPFRSFAHLGVEPRPYQLVPLLLALKLDPVRLLIADDVGIGKTIEAGLIARELLDRGEITRMAVLCPPPLAEQWQRELSEKFHIDAELVLPGTAARLERTIRLGKSVFERYPFVVVSLDYIKSDRHRSEFIRTCPELVIVDEAHTCASSNGRGTRHQRHRLIQELAKKPDRHMIFVTATPHSGDEGAFRSLLRFLKEDFDHLPEDLSGPTNERQRREVAAHFIQRRRGDILEYGDTNTPFAKRIDREDSYKLTPSYLSFLGSIIEYARETVLDPSGKANHQRVRWWSALALLRSVASSPAAAATLRNRAVIDDTTNPEELEQRGRRSVLDLVDEDTAEGSDLAPTGDASTTTRDEVRNQKRLLALAESAETLYREHDAKLQRMIANVKTLLKEGYQPIIFCRFIPTAEYLKDELRQALPKTVTIESVTGLLPPDEREQRVSELAQSEKRILVATDCLSEGINLQFGFNAVIHYDLSWNPTRHEQREGRVDRYGQPKPQVLTLTYYGIDNQIDGIILDILLKKHKLIRSHLGISVPIPVDATKVMEAVFEGLLLREQQHQQMQLYLPGLELPHQTSLFRQWDASAQREKRTRTIFAQGTIKVDEVVREFEETRKAIGGIRDIEVFVKTALSAYGASVNDADPVSIDLSGVPRALMDTLHCVDIQQNKILARFDQPTPSGVSYLNRTHPFVEGLAGYVMDTALDPLAVESIAHRCGVIRTAGVAKRTTLLLLRVRYHIITEYLSQPSQELLAEECLSMAFSGAPTAPEWLDSVQTEQVFGLTPQANIDRGVATDWLNKVIENVDHLRPKINELALQRSEALLDAHKRVRVASKQRGVLNHYVKPQLPIDILGIFLYLPVVQGALA